MPAKSDYVASKKKELTRLESELKRLEAREMHTAVRVERGPWVDTTHDSINEWKNRIKDIKESLRRRE